MTSLSESESDAKIVRIPSSGYVPDPRGLGCVYFEHMLKHKDKIAQVDTLTGEKDTFGALLQRCIRTAISMRAKGVTPSDIVAICSFNHLNVCVPYIATLFLGAKITALDPTISLKDTVRLLKQTTPKLIFVIPEAVQLIEDAIEETSGDSRISVFGYTQKYTPFDDFLQPSEEEDKFKPVEAKSVRDTAIIIFSSGTSGLPKGICINHFALQSQIENAITCGYCLDVLLLSTSLYWITAIFFMGTSLVYGLTRLIVPKFEISAIWNTIKKHKPTFMFLAPAQILPMCNQGRPKDLHTCSLKVIAVGGSPIMKEQIETVQKVFREATVLNVYGQTEVAGYITRFNLCNLGELEFARKKPKSCGTGLPGISYKVVDIETGKLLGQNQSGEIRVKTELQLNGYYKMDSSEAWDSEGWVKTGDVGYYDEDRCFYIVDRVKEMLKFQSWHVPPAVLEEVLLTHPDVAGAVVIGIPHEMDGDHPMAVVVLKKTANWATPQSIESFVEDRVLDRQRLRAGVKIVDRIPTTPSGKIKRRDVRDMVLQGLM